MPTRALLARRPVSFNSSVRWLVAWLVRCIARAPRCVRAVHHGTEIAEPGVGVAGRGWLVGSAVHVRTHVSLVPRGRHGLMG
jgi:hypothetical protein